MPQESTMRVLHDKPDLRDPPTRLLHIPVCISNTVLHIPVCVSNTGHTLILSPFTVSSCSPFGENAKFATTKGSISKVFNRTPSEFQRQTRKRFSYPPSLNSEVAATFFPSGDIATLGLHSLVTWPTSSVRRV